MRKHFRRRVVEGISEKQCTSCEEWLTLDQYQVKTSNGKSYLRSWCKDCFRVQSCLRYEGGYKKKAAHGNGWKHSQGYRCLYVDGKEVLEHRHVWEKHNGPIPKGYEIHHKNGIKTDNEIDNLQMLTCSEHAKLHSPKGYWNGKISS
jgi:hypothetical protein